MKENRLLIIFYIVFLVVVSLLVMAHLNVFLPSFVNYIVYIFYWLAIITFVVYLVLFIKKPNYKYFFKLILSVIPSGLFLIYIVIMAFMLASALEHF